MFPAHDDAQEEDRHAMAELRAEAPAKNAGRIPPRAIEIESIAVE
jgi:hypothetical protein